MKPGSTGLLKKNVEMDETLIGGYSEGKPGMSHDDKEVVMVAVERLDNGLTEHRAPANRRFRQRNFEQAADETVDKEAAIITNDFSSWVALKKDMPNIKTKKSENGVAFKEMHKQIMLMKMWLKGNHHKCSEKFLQGYFEEYAFSFNNRNQRHKIFDLLIGQMMHLQPQPLVKPKKLCVSNP